MVSNPLSMVPPFLKYHECQIKSEFLIIWTSSQGPLPSGPTTFPFSSTITPITHPHRVCQGQSLPPAKCPFSLPISHHIPNTPWRSYLSSQTEWISSLPTFTPPPHTHIHTHTHFLWHLTLCLSPFQLLSQNTTHRVAYKQQKFLSQSSGSFKSKNRVPADLASGEDPFPDNLPCRRGGRGGSVGSREPVPFIEGSTLNDRSTS